MATGWRGALFTGGHRPLLVMPNISFRKSRPGHTFGAPSISVSGCGNHKPRRKFNAEHKNVTPPPSVIESEPMFELNAAAEAVIAEARPRLSFFSATSLSQVWQ